MWNYFPTLNCGRISNRLPQMVFLMCNPSCSTSRFLQTKRRQIGSELEICDTLPLRISDRKWCHLLVNKLQQGVNKRFQWEAKWWQRLKYAIIHLHFEFLVEFVVIRKQGLRWCSMVFPFISLILYFQKKCN